MTIVVGFDVHRSQITFDQLDRETGELRRGRIEPATRESLRLWLCRYQGEQVEAALEATTGWLFVADELERAGAGVHLAEPAETRARRGPKRRAKTDRADARHLRELLAEGRLPEAWRPPAHIQELRTRVRLRKTLVDERTRWLQRIHATLFHHGLPAPGALLSHPARARLAGLELPPAARERIAVALALAEALDAQLAPLEAELRAFARRQPGCRALMREHGIGPLLAPTILAEYGDVRRFGASRRALRHTGLDITVAESAGRRAPGKLSRQGPQLLRWALCEAAKRAAHPSAPDHPYYAAVRERSNAGRATLSVARRLARRCYHRLSELGEEALVPA